MEYLHSLSQGGGKGCQSWATPSVPFPRLSGLGTERQTTGRGVPVYPASSGAPGILQHLSCFLDWLVL